MKMDALSTSSEHGSCGALGGILDGYLFEIKSEDVLKCTKRETVSQNASGKKRKLTVVVNGIAHCPNANDESNQRLS